MRFAARLLGTAVVRPAPRLPVHVAERRRLPHPGSRMGRARRRCPAPDLRQIHRARTSSRNTGSAKPCARLTMMILDLGTCWHSEPQMTAPGRLQPPRRTKPKISTAQRFRRSKPLTRGLESGAGGARTHDRRIVSPARQQPRSGCLTWADTNRRDHGCARLSTYLA